MFAKVKVENILWVNCRKRGSHIQPSVWEKKTIGFKDVRSKVTNVHSQDTENLEP